MIHYRLSTLILAMSFASIVQANNGIHYTNQNQCEICDDVEEPDERAWYRRQEYRDYGENEDPSEELNEDSSWAGAREEFSDTLFDRSRPPNR